MIRYPRGAPEPEALALAQTEANLSAGIYSVVIQLATGPPQRHSATIRPGEVTMLHVRQ